MNQFTKEQRHEIYNSLLDILNERKHPNFPWMCNILLFEFHSNIKEFPELVAKHPDVTPEGTLFVDIDCAWFAEADVQSRIKIVKACIRETAPKNKSK